MWLSPGLALPIGNELSFKTTDKVYIIIMRQAVSIGQGIGKC